MGTKERKDRERIARRAAILEAAKTIFAQKGLLASTIDEIAERAELGKGTIYLYFKAKEEMYVALEEEGLTLLARRFAAVIDPSLPADKNLGRLLDAYYRFYLEAPNYFKLHMLCSLSDIKSKVDTQRVEQQGMACLKLVSDVIQKGIADGLFSPAVDPWKAAAIAWATALGIIFLFEQDPEKAKVLHLRTEELLNIESELFIRGILKAK